MMHVGFLVFPQFNILDLSGPLAAFDVPRREVSPSRTGSPRTRKRAAKS